MVVVNIMGILPVVFDLASPDLAKKIFHPISEFVTSHQKMIISIILFGLSGYMFYRVLF